MWRSLALLEPPLALLSSPLDERPVQLLRDIDAALVMIPGRCEDAVHQVPADRPTVASRVRPTGYAGERRLVSRVGIEPTTRRLRAASEKRKY